MSCRFVRWDEVPGRCEHVPGSGARVAPCRARRVHVGEVLRLDAPDADVLAYAVRNARVIVAADTDFGDLLAARQVAEPSVMLFHRQAGRRPRVQAALLLANLPSVESDLQDGAIVVVEERRLRVRSLPVTEPGEGRRT